MRPQSQPIIEWLGTTPHEWSQPRLKAVFRDDTGSITMQQLTDLEVQHYSIPNFDEFGAAILEDGATIASNKTLLHGGEILFSKLNCHKPRVWIVPQDDHVKVASTEFIPLAEWHSGSVDKAFITYLIGSAVFAEYMTCFQTSVTNSHRRINPNDLWQTRVPLPPLPEQRHIAAYLDASCAAIDAAVIAKRRQLEILDALRTTLVYEAVTQGINSSAATVVHDIPSYGITPKHWKRSKLRYEISIQNGDFASDKLQDDGAYPIYGGNGVMGHIDLSNVDGETVVIGRVGAYCGNAHYVRGKAWVSDNALIVKSRHHAHFICYLFNALNFNAQANNTAQPVITGTKIKNTYVVLPPFKEQEAICYHLDEKLAELKRIFTGIEAQIATLIAYRKSLIHECVTGQRRISKVDVVRSQLSENTGQLKLQPSEKTADGGRPAMLCRPDQSPAMNTEDLL